MKGVAELTDDELRVELNQHGFNAPPITDTTRILMQKKLEAFRGGSDTISKKKTTQQKNINVGQAKPTPAAAARSTPSVPASNKDDSFIGKPSPSSFSQQKTNGADSSTTSSSSFISPPRQQPQQPSPRSPLRMFSDGGISTSSINKPTSPYRPIISAPKTRLSDIGPSTGTGHRLDSFEQSGFEQSLLFGGEQDEDDHMESSRIVSPRSRFQPIKTQSDWKSTPRGQKDSSPVEKFKNFGRTAWGFFSRPLGTSTPCSDAGFKNTGYATSTYKKYRRYDSNDFSTTDNKGWMPSLSADVSSLIGKGIIGFFVFLAAIYVYRAHTETVHGVAEAGKDFTVATFNFLYSYAIYPVGVVLGVLLLLFFLYKLFDYWRQSKADEKKKLIQLVERITDIIYESGAAGIAEPHVRDMLMPPTKRTEGDYKKWQAAARFINNEDSRIRTEIRLIDGMECNVWIWTGAGKQRWQGTAVPLGSPLAKVPEQALSRCLKLRGVDFSDNSREQDCLRRELVAKLKPILPEHIAFSNSGNENVIYMKLKDYDDAKRAFLAFHSHWFNGSMITVKYLRDERYLERFPEAR